MNNIVEKVMKTMPASPTELNEKNIVKIKTYLPVPNDFEILWADIQSFSGYPEGTVITDRGIILKASRRALKERKKGESKNENELKLFYQIVLWEYFDPEAFSFEKKDIDGEKVYVLSNGDILISYYKDKNVYSFFSNYEKELKIVEAQYYDFSDLAALGEVETLNFEQTAFNAAYGADQSKTGHGIYAEEGSTILDKLNGDKSTVVGRDNAKNGPDKLVNGEPVQCKFCKTASSSVGACFKKNPDTGLLEYRYYDLKSGKPMQVEVPTDQYEKAILAMEKKISKGQVPGVTDPNQAKDLIRKSKLTYAQARNLAKAGTFESISFDIATGTVTCTFAAGISALASFGIVFWKTKNRKKAQDAAIDTAVQVFGPAFAANLISNQIARTGLTDAMIPISEKITNTLGTKLVTELVNARRALLGQAKISGSAASKSFAKALRSTAVSEGVLFTVFAVPDVYRAINNKINGAQFWKNMVSLSASFFGNIAGTYVSGIALGKIGEKIGKKFDKKAGAVVGFLGGLAGGTILSVAAKTLTGLFKEDDAVITARLFNAVIANMAVDYLMSEKEIDSLISELDNASKDINKMQRYLLQSNHQYYDIEQFLSPYFENVVKGRDVIKDEEVFEMPMNPAFA